jgi:hypothetical protein
MLNETTRSAIKNLTYVLPQARLTTAEPEIS